MSSLWIIAYSNDVSLWEFDGNVDHLEKCIVAPSTMYLHKLIRGSVKGA